MITMAKDFFEYLNFDSDGEHVGECLSQCFEIAFRFGLTSGGSFGDPSKCHVSVMMNLELKEKKLSLPNGIRDLEHLARTQRPKMLARWEASRATGAARAELKRCEAAESLAKLDLLEARTASRRCGSSPGGDTQRLHHLLTTVGARGPG